MVFVCNGRNIDALTPELFDIETRDFPGIFVATQCALTIDFTGTDNTCPRLVRLFSNLLSHKCITLSFPDEINTSS
jgi:hypothetical protein